MVQFCRYCGSKLPADALFCNVCGRQLASNAGEGTQSSAQATPGSASSPGLSIPAASSPDATQISSPSGIQPPVQASSPSQPSWPGQPPSAPSGIQPTIQATPPPPGYQPTVQASSPSQPSWPVQSLSTPSGIQPTVQAPPPLPGYQPTVQAAGPASQPSWPGQPGTYQPDPYYQAPPPPPQPGTYYQAPPPPPSTPFFRAPSLYAPRQRYNIPPQTGLQKRLVSIFQPVLANNAFFGIMLGTLLATILGGAVSGLLVGLIHLIAPLPSTQFGASQADNVFYALGLIPLHSPFRDALQLLFVANGAAFKIQYSGNTTYASSVAFNATLNGLLIIPALCLTLGGYVAASTDFSNRAGQSLWRGAAIALPYAILMLIFMPAVNGNLPLYPGESAGNIDTFSTDGASLFVLCLLWGAGFGLLGASLKLGRGRWRQMISAALRFNRLPQAGAALVGALAAIGLGLALSLLSLYSLLAYTSFSNPIYSQNICNTSDWQSKVAWGLGQGPLHAANLFMYSFNAPIKIVNSANGSPCFYSTHNQTTLNMLGGSPHLPPWTYAFLAIAVISLFLGGRLSAGIGRAQRAGLGLLQGAAIAVPFTILMMLLAVVTFISWQSTFSNPNGVLQTYTQSAGVSSIDVLPWAFLSSALLGALGGLYQTTSFGKGMSAFLRVLAAPLRLLGKLAALLGERLRGQPRASRPTAALFLLYNAFFWTVVLTVLAIAASVFLIVQNQTVALQVNHTIRDVLSTVLVALPGLLLVCAGGAALAEDTLSSATSAMPMPAQIPTGR